MVAGRQFPECLQSGAGFTWGKVACFLPSSVSPVPYSRVPALPSSQPQGCPITTRPGAGKGKVLHMDFYAQARELVSKMTLEEKDIPASARGPAIERLGIPAYNWWNECLHGLARSGSAPSSPGHRHGRQF